MILATNNGKKPFDNPKVRQAIAHAINREELISAESGFGVPIGSHFAPHNKAYIDLTKTYPFDLAKAKALLAEAGYPNGFEASLKLPPVGYAQRAGEVMANQLGKIGIKLAIIQPAVAAMALRGRSRSATTTSPSSPTPRPTISIAMPATATTGATIRPSSRPSGARSWPPPTSPSATSS